MNYNIIGPKEKTVRKYKKYLITSSPNILYKWLRKLGISLFPTHFSPVCLLLYPLQLLDFINVSLKALPLHCTHFIDIVNVSWVLPAGSECLPAVCADRQVH